MCGCVIYTGGNSFAIIGCSIEILFNRIYFWFKYETLMDISLYSFFTPNKWAGKEPFLFLPNLSNTQFSEWLQAPHDWFGLHLVAIQILKIMPIWLVGLTLGFIILFACSAIADLINKKIEKYKSISKDS